MNIRAFTLQHNFHPARTRSRPKGRRKACGLGVACRYVAECMDEHQEMSVDTPIFNAMGLILKHEFVLVRSRDGIISGIVTTTDLGKQFRELSEPYLLLADIENYLRA